MIRALAEKIRTMVNDFNFNAEDQRLIDLLVDGELPADERRQLLNRFEQEPAGWRQCALAFLEAQSWRGDLRALLKEAAPNSTLPEVSRNDDELAQGLSGESFDRKLVARKSTGGASGTQRAAHRGSGSGWLLPLYTLAAGLLVALGVGLGWRWNPHLPTGGAAVDLAGSRGGSAWTGSGRQPAAPRRSPSWGNVNLVVDPGNSRLDSQVQVPVVEGPGVNDRWLREQPSPVPSDVVRALEQMGNQVHQQRRLVPFRLDDGRQLVVPVDQVDVQPVDLRAFQ